MPSIRPERIGEMMRTDLSELIRDMKDPRIGFVSIMNVEVSRDIRVAKVYFSVLGDDEAKKNSQKGLDSASGYLRSELSHRIQLRYMPELRFLLDTTIEHGVRISKLLHDVNQPKAPKEQDND